MNTLVLTRKDLTEIVKTLGRDALMDEVLLELARVLKEHDDARTQIPKRQGFTYGTPHPPFPCVPCRALGGPLHPLRPIHSVRW